MNPKKELIRSLWVMAAEVEDLGLHVMSMLESRVYRI